jgi:hypothetical protein
MSSNAISIPCEVAILEEISPAYELLGCWHEYRPMCNHVGIARDMKLLYGSGTDWDDLVGVHT